MRQHLIVFTDLDATLLDEETYGLEEAAPALDALRRAEAALVLCTGKTRAEVEPLHRELGLTGPFVFENGGGIVFPALTPGWRVPFRARGGGPFVVPLGEPHEKLVRALAAIAAETGLRLVGLSELTIHEIVERTGLPPQAASLAAAREFDEPFILEDAGPSAESALAEAAERRGLRLHRGGRFHHLTGTVDKGRAVRQLLALHEGPVLSLALGDSENDLAMLRAADRPVIVPRRNGVPNAALLDALPHARRAPFPGPRGWNDAVLAELQSAGYARALAGQ